MSGRLTHMKAWQLVIVSVCISLAQLFGIDLSREWTSGDGRKLQGSIRQASDVSVTLVIDRKQAVEIPLGKLSPSDQGYVKKWVQDEPSRSAHFTVEALGSKASDARVFMKANDTAKGTLVGAGPPVEITISNGKTSYSVRPSVGDIIFEVRAKLIPGRTATGPQALEVSNLRLRYLSGAKTEETVAVGPRWNSSDKSKFGSHESFNVESGKAVEFGVAFKLSPKDKPLALEYTGAVQFEVPIR